MIQLREKELSDRELLDLAERTRELCRAAGALFIVNDRPDVARLAGADGVHVGSTDLPAGGARAIVGKRALVGVSAHDEAEIDAALQAGADYLGIGTVYPSGTKPGLPARGLEVVRLAARSTSLPFFAIGGIAIERLAEVLAAGARGVAVSGAILQAPDPRAATEAFRRVLDAHFGEA